MIEPQMSHRLLGGSPPPRSAFSDYRLLDGTMGCDEALAGVGLWSEEPKGWELLIGPPGVGKTHLAWAAAQASAARHETRFASWLEMLDNLKTQIRKSVKGEEATLQLSAYSMARVLILDDLRAPRSEWETETLRKVVHVRHRLEFPTLVTTNYTTLEIRKFLPGDVASRLLDRGLVTVHHLIGPDYRRWE